MARAVLSPVGANMQGVQVTLAAPTVDGDAVQPHSLLWVTNGSGATITLTFVSGGTVDSLDVADPTATVPAGQTRLFGPFDAGVLPQPSGATEGMIHVNYSAQASVTRASLSLGY